MLPLHYSPMYFAISPRLHCAAGRSVDADRGSRIVPAAHFTANLADRGRGCQARISCPHTPLTFGFFNFCKDFPIPDKALGTWHSALGGDSWEDRLPRPDCPVFSNHHRRRRNDPKCRVPSPERRMPSAECRVPMLSHVRRCAVEGMRWKRFGLVARPGMHAVTAGGRVGTPGERSSGPATHAAASAASDVQLAASDALSNSRPTS